MSFESLRGLARNGLASTRQKRKLSLPDIDVAPRIIVRPIAIGPIAWSPITCLRSVGAINQDMITFIAPLTLVLGAGLCAAGILSFLDIHFFKNKFAERAALAGGLALIVLTEFIFAASGMSMRFLNGQRSDLLECRLDAETAMPNERRTNSPMVHEHIVRSLYERFRVCMDDGPSPLQGGAGFNESILLPAYTHV